MLKTPVYQINEEKHVGVSEETRIMTILKGLQKYSHFILSLYTKLGSAEGVHCKLQEPLKWYYL